MGRRFLWGLPLCALMACSYSGLDLDGKRCDSDGRSCPEGYLCVAGADGGMVCRPESGWDGGAGCVTNQDCEDENPCSADFCIANRCQYTDFPDGLNCSDQDSCTSEDACSAGVCQGSTKDCSAFDGPCVIGECDPENGECQARPRADGTGCDDGLYCTSDDTCQSGDCLGSPLGCADDDACTRDECNEGDSTCESIMEPVPGAEGLEVGDTCSNSIDDDCDGRTDGEDPNCLSCGQDDECNDDNPCTEDTCLQSHCLNSLYPDGTVCDDGLFCTVMDMCNAGVCQGEERDCSGVTSACRSGVCVESSDSCQPQDRPDGTPCDDQSYCTEADECLAGECAGVARDCDDGDFCTADSCDPVGQVCEHLVTPIPGAEGPPDDPSCQNEIDDDCDGLSDLQDPNCEGCTSDGQCDDGNQCTQDLCANYECQNEPLTDGTACDDGVNCLENDSCQAGVCSSTPVDCSGLEDACHYGVCIEATGLCEAQPKPDQTPCDDGQDCTVADVCVAGECLSGLPKDCSSLDDECNLGVCDPASGQCQANPANPGEACGDPADSLCDDPDSCDDQGHCQPNHYPALTFCHNGDLVSCDGSGSQNQSTDCPLGCNPDAVPPRCNRLNPSNIDDAAREVAGLDPLLCAGTQAFDPGDFTGTGELCIDTDDELNPIYDCPGWQPIAELQPAVITLVSQDPAPEILVLSYTSITLPDTVNLYVRGERVLVLLACGDVSIAGRLWPNAPDRSAGPGGGNGGRAREDGSAWGYDGYGRRGTYGGGDWPSPGGGGGGFGDQGGDGGNTSAKNARLSGGDGGHTFLGPELMPLVGGGGGGGGDDESSADGGATRGGHGGGGGGGLQISAGGQITILAAGGINAAGAGGEGAWGSGAAGGGGGAGGGILLEATVLQMDGILAANGGGGGGGGTTGADDGDRGRFDAQPADGGNGQGSNGSDGGDGGAGNDADGQNGGHANFDAGGGGGSCGRIRLNTRDPADLTIGDQAVISPSQTPEPPGTDCSSWCTSGNVAVW